MLYQDYVSENEEDPVFCKLSVMEWEKVLCIRAVAALK